MCKAEAIFFRRNDLCAQTICIHLTLNELCAAHFTYFSQINRFVHIQKPEIKRMSGICVAQNLFSKKFSAFVCTQMLLVKKNIVSDRNRRRKTEKGKLLRIHKPTKSKELCLLFKHKCHS